jgi:glycosyltransferase involved in cell wall biosynthesis
MPKVSIIIPTYNRERYVVKAIDSVLRQTFKDYEIIVVDDGSTDNTKEVVNQYGNRIRYIHQANSGVSAARNTGIKHARGEWLAFLDSDDEWLADYLYKQMKSLDSHPTVCMQVTDSLFIDLNGDTRRYFNMNRSLAEFHGKDYLFFEQPFRFLIKHGPWQIGSTVIRRDAIMKAGLFNTSLSLSEDLDLMARVALQGPLGMIREELVHVYRRDESIACLTSQICERPMETRESTGRIYENLGQLGSLTHKERTALNGILSANKRAMGNLLLAKGKVSEARDVYTRALVTYPCIASLGKCILSFLPARWVIQLPSVRWAQYLFFRK